MTPVARRILAACLGLLGAWARASETSASTIDWRESAPMPEPASGYAAGVLGGRLVLIGGTYWEGSPGNWTKKVFTAAANAFDPKAQKWEKLPDAPITVGYPACAQVGDALYVMGGEQNDAPGRAVYEVRWGKAGLNWRRHGWLPAPRLFGTAVSVGRTIYVMGGTAAFEPYDAKGTCCTTRTASDTMWALDPSDPSNQWKELPRIPGHPRWASRAIAQGGAIYLLGGSYQGVAADPWTRFNDVWRYDIAASRWTRLGDLPEAMQGVGPVAAGGRTFLIGPGRHSMVFDPGTAAFTPTTALPEDADVDGFFWIDGRLVGASGECARDLPRRRSPWTFIGRPTAPGF